MICHNRDTCKSCGPIPLCWHHHYGAQVGRAETRQTVDGHDHVVYLVTEDDCARCTFDGKISNNTQGQHPYVASESPSDQVNPQP